MTLIAGIGFLDEAYLLCDSRISYDGGNKDPEDKLMKIYQIAPNMAVAFASQNVGYTLEVLRRVTKFSLHNLQTKKSKFILPYLIRQANFEYNNISKEYNIKPPGMEFIYAGVANKPQMFSSDLMFDLMKKIGSFKVHEKIGKAMMQKTEGIWSLDPPCPILYKQTFPTNPDKPFIYLGYVTGGSGQEVFYDIENEYPELFNFDFSIGRGVILEQIVNDYINNKSIITVGGIVQIWRINSNGLQPITYAWKQHNKNGHDKLLKELKFINKEWIMVDYQTGKTSKASFGTNLYIKMKGNLRRNSLSWSNY